MLQTAFVLLSAAAALIAINTAAKPKNPVQTSILTGQHWLYELFHSLVHMYKQLGMSKNTFRKLCNELQLQHGLSDSKYISADEQLAIFLNFAHTGASSHILQERFQCSRETISQCDNIYLLLINF